MKTFRMIGMALVAVMLSFTMSSCDNDDDEVDPYKDYPQLIVGQWFDFTPESSIFLNIKADGTYNLIGYDNREDAWGWMSHQGEYRLEGNKFIWPSKKDPSRLATEEIEVTANKMIMRTSIGDKVHYRVQNSFDIKGNYTYLNAAARVVPAEGKTALQLPEGFLFNGENTIPVESLNGERIIDASKAFFADATFAEDGKLNHTMNGEAKVKNYTLNGNNLVFNLYEGSDVYKINATSFPDEDGDRLFIIMPKQAAWIGGFVSIIEEQNEGKKFSEAQIAELEEEFMDTFETLTVILSLSKK